MTAEQRVIAAETRALQADQRALDSGRCAVEADQRAAEANRRAHEAEQRAVKAEQDVIAANQRYDNLLVTRKTELKELEFARHAFLESPKYMYRALATKKAVNGVSEELGQDLDKLPP